MVAIISEISGQYSNSYASMSEAEKYFSQRLYSSAYETAIEDDKVKALIMATSLLETLVAWSGTKSTEIQRLSFPREGLINAQGESILPGVIPQAIKAAEFELALVLLQENTIANTGTLGISELEVGPIKLALDPDRKKNVFPDIVYELIAPFGIPNKRDMSTGAYTISLLRS